MLSKLKQRKEKGFTIIEVLIVLAIAGLILLVVFLAVPALQRNSRNTTRSNDVAGLLGGMAEFVNSNNGSLPTAVSGTGTTVTIGAAGTNQVEVNLGYYGGGDVSIGSGAFTNPSNENTVVIRTGTECGGTGSVNAVAGPSRGYVALYTLEDSAEQCKES